MNKKVIKKVFKTLIAAVILTMCSVGLSKVVEAADAIVLPRFNGSLTGGMLGHSNGNNPATTLTPQTTSGGIIFCNDQFSMVRWGSKDTQIHYATKEQYESAIESRYIYNGVNDRRLYRDIMSYGDKLVDQAFSNKGVSGGDRDMEAIEDGDKAKNKDRDYPSNISIKWTKTPGVGKPDDNQPFIAATDNSSDMIDKSIQASWNALQDISDNLSQDKKPQRYLTGFDSEKEYEASENWARQIIKNDVVTVGPQVAIIGNGDSSYYNLQSQSSYDTRSQSDYKSAMESYILTGEYHKSRQDTVGYDLIDVQVANWLHDDSKGTHHGYITDGNGNVSQGPTLTQGATTRGNDLWNEAREFYAFITRLKEVNYDYTKLASVDMSNAQAFASRDDGNRGNDEYIIGPVSITYPYYHNVSYMTDIVLDTKNKDGESATLSYKNGDFEIVTQTQGETKLTSGSVFPGESGLETENFYIIVNASKANYPDEVSVKGQFEYTDYCITQAGILNNPMNVYRYVGVSAFGRIETTVKYYWVTTVEETQYDANGNPKRDENGNKITKTVYKSHSDSLSFNTVVQQAYVVMDITNYYGLLQTDNSQELKSVPYKDTTISKNEIPDNPNTYAHKSTAEISASKDISMKLGGNVWLDVETGKESLPSGASNTEGTKPMQNVIVKLHQRKPNGDESVKAQTTTDTNGHYEFENLNSLYTYYVEFVYNGQYFEPTIYKKDGVSWENSSKGVDKTAERNSFNMKFKEIGSTPANLQKYAQDNIYSPTFTRNDLYEGGYIDEFANLTDKTNNGQDAQSVFAKDCMMSSYTGYNQNGNFTIDYYPVYTKFVVDDLIKPIHSRLGMAVRDSSGKDITTYDSLYAGDYNNLYVNQGYLLRKTADLSLYKDVLNTTVEMNGKSQTYKYDKNDPDNIIELKASDVFAYYGRNYTREIYKEDYFKPLDSSETGLSADELMKVYVTYKIRLRNSAQVIAASGVEIVDYYDNEYTLIGSEGTLQPSEEKYRPYVADRKGTTKDETIKVKTSTTSKYAKYNQTTQKNIAGYNTTYITIETTDGKDERILQPSSDLYIYVTFKVKDIGHFLVLDDGNGTNDNGKVNIVEINGYRTYYGEKSQAPNANNSKTDTEYVPGDVAGLVDVDSIAGNINTSAIGNLGKNTTFEQAMENDSNFQNTINSIDKNDPDYDVKVNEAKTKWLRENYGMEDDSDKAPQIKLQIAKDENAARTVSGMVWEDKRTDTINEIARVGNGKIDQESGISGVKVQLVDIRQSAKNQKEIVAKVLQSNGDTSWTWSDGSTNASLNNAPSWNEAVTTTSDNGEYSFSGYIPSNYVMKFTYGIDGMKRDENGGIIYNGHDYKSTEYYTPISDSNGNTSFDINNPDNNAYTYTGTINEPVEARTYNIYNAKGNDPTTTYFYNLAQADEDNKANNRYSDARDIMGPDASGSFASGTRAYVNNYSNNAGNGVTNTLAQELHDRSTANYADNTFMVAQSGQIDVEIEYNRTQSDTGDITSSGNQDTSTSENFAKAGYYKIENLDLGLVERSKSQLKVTKQVTNVRVTLANGNTLFDASNRATNVLWSNHVAHNQDSKNTYAEDDNYTDKMMKEPSVRSNASNKGLIQLTMDEELMQGANIRITYAITVANIGEVDYEGNEFYYTGFNTSGVNYYTGKNGATGETKIVTTTPDNLIDYVGYKTDENTGGTTTVTRNNLQFNSDDNPDWEVITQDGITSNGYLNAEVLEKAKLYNTIVVTKESSSSKKELVPIIADQDAAKQIRKAFDDDPLNALTTVNQTNSVSGVQLVLTQPLSPDLKTDDMSYSNLVELVRTSNKLGRRMEYSVVGNQNPTTEPAEIDADSSQDVTILPPFGQQYIYYVLGGVIGLILIAGITMTIIIMKKRK